MGGGDGQKLRGERSGVWRDAGRDFTREFASQLKSADEVSTAGWCNMKKAKATSGAGSETRRRDLSARSGIRRVRVKQDRELSIEGGY